MENGPQSFRPEALTHLEQQTKRLEQYLLRGRIKESKKERLLDNVLYDIGADTVDRKVRLFAVGYSIDADNYTLPLPLIVDSSEARLREVVIRTLEREERAFLRYELYDPLDATVADQVLVPPLGILELVVDEEQGHPFFEAIDTSKTHAEKLFREQDFFKQSVDNQIELLKKQVSDLFVADVTLDYTEDVTLQIGCDWYYQLPLVDTLSDDWSQYIQRETVLEGRMVNAVYPEFLRSLPQQITSKDAFSDGQGLPYIVLESEAVNGLLLVPLAGIRSFTSDIDD